MRSRALLASLIAVGVALLCGLGIWQVQRLFWKLDLIHQVETRLAAPPIAAPGPGDWQGIAAYTRVEVVGHYDTTRESLVQALTVRGAGYWVMTPLVTPKMTVLVNRGFVPQDRRAPQDRPAPGGEVQVTGLLRLTEPGGGFLRANDPAADRWYSRDVAALAAAHDLGGAVAPYFIDAGAGPDPAALPVGGLTVVAFRNSHLVYALTWFAMAAGLALGGIYVLRRGRA